ncbi:DNA polymerase/3'-5' exonuclease PolX [candidate division WOR-3 bacterium]|nr:DNA polymerase/3'-5' exonuclease PolX [candidate division WOR-3 bacterium]
MRNQELARLFTRIADAFELKGETGFRVLAYRKAARTLTDLGADIETLDQEGKLQEVPGIGEGIAKKIHEFLSTGRMRKYDEAVAGLPAGLFEMLDLQGVGPKTVKQLYDKLGVRTTTELKQAIENGRLAELPGMGEKKAANILQSIRTEQLAGDRMCLDEAFELAETVTAHMKRCAAVRHVVYGGSLRRGRETIGDIDILATGRPAARIIEHFTRQPRVKSIIAAGGTKASVRLESHGKERQVDLRVLAESEYGAALQYFTGSKDHNVALRALAQKQGLKLSEYGLFRGKKRVAGRSEQEVYLKLGLPYIEPELRENRGELEAAAEHRLPVLVSAKNIKCDLHVHTSASDGAADLEEMVEACRLRGYTHVAITDHSVSAGYAGGLSADALLRHCDRVDDFNSRSRDIKVLKSSEVDIRSNGSLDYPDKVLERLDLVIASIHQGFKKEVTKRMCSALANPLAHLVAHPTGRIIGRREGYDVDLEQVIECAAKNRKILEINAFCGRLDLNDVWARRATQAGVRLAINTDAHGVGDLGWIRYGLLVARRAWLTKSDVVNCLSYSGLMKLLGATRTGRIA